MRCSKESFREDTYFHIYNHSIDNLDLFRVDEDYLLCLKKIKQKIKLYPTSIFAYCLMPNHFHFFIRQDSDKPVFRIFNDVFAGYVQIYNKKYNRKGRLFRNPLQHKIVENDAYALQLCQYIHFNPKKASLVNELETWQYSNFLEWIGKRNGSIFCNEILINNGLTSEMYSVMMKEYDYLQTEEYIRKYLF
ncbi:MAG: transposase [Candidatus Cloacimonadales bacterium]|nr:transposase [Candidatus Cloacimonadales bacterium]